MTPNPSTDGERAGLSGDARRLGLGCGDDVSGSDRATPPPGVKGGIRFLPVKP